MRNTPSTTPTKMAPTRRSEWVPLDPQRRLPTPPQARRSRPRRQRMQPSQCPQGPSVSGASSSIDAHSVHREYPVAVIGSQHSAWTGSPLVMPPFLPSAFSSRARSKGLPGRSERYPGQNVISGPRISSSTARHSRLVPHHYFPDVGLKSDLPDLPSQLKKPIPDDLVPILTQDEEQQRKQTREKTKSDSVSDTARATVQATPLPTLDTPPQQPVPVVKITTNPTLSKPFQSATMQPPIKSDASAMWSGLFTQAIPAFAGGPSNTQANANKAVPRFRPSNPPPGGGDVTMLDPDTSLKPNPQVIVPNPISFPADALFYHFAHSFGPRVSPQLLQVATFLSTKQCPLSPWSQIHSLISQSTRQLFYTLVTTSPPSMVTSTHS